MAAVRRIYHPGTKFDQLLVLEGEQDLGKSGLISVLTSPAWFTDCLSVGDDPKVIVEQTRGRLLAEFSELDGIGRRDIERIKSMLSRQTDSARLSYDKSTTSVPRQFVLIGTTNDRHYLQDYTGNRRFWPVRVGSVDFEALKQDRDQLWAEAVHYEATGESLELPANLRRIATGLQGQRTTKDPLEEAIEEAVDGKTGIIPVEDMYAVMGLGGDRIAQRKTHHSKLLLRVMEKHGWIRTRIRDATISKNPNDNRAACFHKMGDQEVWRYSEEERTLVVRPPFEDMPPSIARRWAGD